MVCRSAELCRSDASPLVLVLDQGGHGSRALVFDPAGVVHAQAAMPVASASLKPGWVEQQPSELLASLRFVLTAVARQLGEHGKRLHSAALIVQRSSLLAWRRSNGRPLYPVLSWQDTRNAAWFARHIRGRESWLRSQTGLRPNAHYGASKMRWLLDHLPVIDVARREGDLCIGPLAAWLQQQLTASAQPQVDAVVAARTLLTRTGQCEWSDDLCDFFAIPAEILPGIAPTRADYGRLRCGEFTVPLRLLGGDQSFLALAGGEPAAGTVFINAGTGAFVQQHSVAPAPDSLLHTAVAIEAGATGNWMVNEGTVNAAASALDWLWQRHGHALAYSELASAMGQADDAVQLFINTLTATGSPDWLPAAEPAFVGQPCNLAQAAVAVLESVIFALQRNLDVLARVQPRASIMVSGGLSRLDGFCQRLADLSCVPVLRSEDTEASARGAAYWLMADRSQWQALPSQSFMPKANAGLRVRYQAWTGRMAALSRA